MHKMIDTIGGESLDQEWVELILSAKQLGLTQEEIRNFFINSTEKKAI